MTGFFELFNPGARHWREQVDTEKMLFVDAQQGGQGRPPDDIDSGRIVIYLPRGGSPDAPSSQDEPDSAGAEQLPSDADSTHE